MQTSIKIKPKLRHFWRNNKRCTGMWMSLLSFAFVILNVCFWDFTGAMYQFNIFVAWSLVWMLERIVNVQRRSSKYLEEWAVNHLSLLKEKWYLEGVFYAMKEMEEKLNAQN